MAYSVTTFLIIIKGFFFFSPTSSGTTLLSILTSMSGIVEVYFIILNKRQSLVNNYVTQQPNEDQGLPVDCRSNIQISDERNTDHPVSIVISFNQHGDSYFLHLFIALSPKKPVATLDPNNDSNHQGCG